MKTNGLAVTGMVLGILSVTVGLCCGGPLFAIPGIIFSGIAISQINRDPEHQTGKGMAVAGIITSVISILVFVATLALMIALGKLKDLPEWRERLDRWERIEGDL